MLYQSLLHYRQPTPAEMRFLSPAIGEPDHHMLPSVEQTGTAPNPGTEACELLADSARLSRFNRVVESLGTFVTRLDESGVMTLLISGTATWPGPVATASRLVVHVTQTAGTYNRVRQFGFTGASALAKTMWWTIAGR